MNEQQVRAHVRKLKRFYTDILLYIIVNFGLILIWAISGGGYFWPIWVIVGWGIGLGIYAFSSGLIPQMNAMIPFMTAEWEDQEVRRLMETDYKGKEKRKATKVEDIVSQTPVKSKTQKATTPSKGRPRKSKS